MVSADDLAACAVAPLLAGLAADDLAALLDGAHAVAYPDPAVLFWQGDPADRFFVVLAGRVTLSALTEGGGQSVIEVFDPVCTFAEAAIFSTGVYPLQCEVAAGSRLVHVPAAPFLRRLRDRPALGLTLLAALSRWQARLTDEIAGLKSRSPAERLAAYLLGLAAGAESGRLRLPLTKAVLASRIGIAPESLSRALARLRAHGIAVSGREIVIADPAALRRFAGTEAD